MKVTSKLAALTFSLFSVLSCLPADAAAVHVRVADATGAGLKNALVIVRSLQDGSEFLRDLSGSDGSVPSIELGPGLYEAIATFPYWAWMTSVRDFNVETKPVTLELRMEPKPSDQTVSIDVLNFHIQVLDRTGKPVVNAWVTGRSPEADGVDVEKTDAEGRATVRIPIGGAEITVAYGDESYVQRVNIPTKNVVQCENVCIENGIDKLNKEPHNLVVRLP